MEASRLPAVEAGPVGWVSEPDLDRFCASHQYGCQRQDACMPTPWPAHAHCWTCESVRRVIIRQDIVMSAGTHMCSGLTADKQREHIYMHKPMACHMPLHTLTTHKIDHKGPFLQLATAAHGRAGKALHCQRRIGATDRTSTLSMLMPDTPGMPPRVSLMAASRMAAWSGVRGAVRSLPPRLILKVVAPAAGAGAGAGTSCDTHKSTHVYQPHAALATI